MPKRRRSRCPRDFTWIVKADSTTDSRVMTRQKKVVKRTTNYLKIQEIFKLEHQKAVNFYASVFRAEQLSNTIWSLSVVDRTGVIRCTCHEGTIRNGVIKKIPFEKGLFLRVHQAEILDKFGERQLNIKIGEAGCQIVLWDQFSLDANTALFFSSRKFTRNREIDQIMLEQNLKELADYIVKKATKNSSPLHVTMSQDIETLATTERNRVVHSSFFYEISPGCEQLVEYYTKCDCAEPENVYIRVSSPQAVISCLICGKSLMPGIKKTIQVKMKTLPDVNLYFVLPVDEIPTNVSICASQATIIGKIQATKYYELYLETIAYRPLTPPTIT